jgi:hypothetical protein
MKEADIQRAFQREIKRLGGKCYKLHGSQFGVIGQPDIVGALAGVSYAIEFKVPGKTASAKQNAELDQWAQQGWATGVAHSVEEAIFIITET